MNASFEYGWRPCHSPGTAGSCTCSPWHCRRFATSTLASLPLILMLNWPHESTHSSRCSVVRWLRRPVVEVPPEYFWTESSLPKACNLLETKRMSQLVDMRWEANLLAEYTCALWAILLEKHPYISSNMTFSIPSWAHMMTGTVMTMRTSSWRASTIYSHGCLWSLKAMGYESLSATARSNGCRGCIVEIEPFVIRMTVAVSRHWFTGEMGANTGGDWRPSSSGPTEAFSPSCGSAWGPTEGRALAAGSSAAGSAAGSSSSAEASAVPRPRPRPPRGRPLPLCPRALPWTLFDAPWSCKVGDSGGGVSVHHHYSGNE